MKTEELEKIIKEIREKEDFLRHLKRGAKLSIAYWSISTMYDVFTLSKKELEVLKKSCLLRIKELRKIVKEEI